MAEFATVPTDPAEFKKFMLDFLADPDISRAVHLKSDVNTDVQAQHHTVGPRHVNAMPGDTKFPGGNVQMQVAQWLQNGTVTTPPFGGGSAPVIFNSGDPVAYTIPPAGKAVSDYFSIGDGVDYSVIKVANNEPGFYGAHFKCSMGGSGVGYIKFVDAESTLRGPGLVSVNIVDKAKASECSIEIPPWAHEGGSLGVEVFSTSGSSLTFGSGILTVIYYGPWDGNGHDDPYA